MFIRKLVCLCGIMVYLVTPVSQPHRVFAESDIPTVMDGVVNHIIDLHHSFAEKVNGARETNISPAVLSTLTTHETIAYEQAQLWRHSLKGNMESIQKQVLEYDKTFNHLYEEMKQQVTTNDKPQLVQLLQTLQHDISNKKESVSEFITKIESLKETGATNSRQLQTDLTQVNLCMDGYRAEVDRLLDQLDKATSSKERELLADQMMEPSAKLYDKLEPLSNNVSALIRNINGVNDGVLTIGWQISLTEMHTNWNLLDSTLTELMAQIKKAPNVNQAFIMKRLNTIKDIWSMDIIGELDN
ncbi:HBL/NHE enterotoxin family protein [Bacillus wiedmannii]|uniref:HBL/NHE enterotoxin family protein n=1 Tax=Bacillus wiedmannii TaxID=1890302 RepID=UPI002E1E94E4|nr:HBL/NHE enterotoxin family protein [Bacillus wiedmannii]